MKPVVPRTRAYGRANGRGAHARQCALYRVTCRAPDDIPQVQEVMALILELRILRESKLASGMRDVLSEGAIVANVTNVSATEANYLREGFMKVTALVHLLDALCYIVSMLQTLT